jgi:hypothetical protein
LQYVAAALRLSFAHRYADHTDTLVDPRIKAWLFKIQRRIQLWRKKAARPERSGEKSQSILRPNCYCGSKDHWQG